MTEPEWLITGDPMRLYRHARGRLSARKLKLLACGCCRLLGPLLSADQLASLMLVERHADGLATEAEYQETVDAFGRGVMATLFQEVEPPAPGGVVRTVEAAVAQALQAVVTPPTDFGLARTLTWLATAARRQAGGALTQPERTERQRQMCEVFREVVGNPFRERVAAGPEWVLAGGRVASWMLKVSETARALARGVEADQAYDRLPILADALEDDGCADLELLHHLRGNVAHLRGCWALDLVLGKA